MNSREIFGALEGWVGKGRESVRNFDEQKVICSKLAAKNKDAFSMDNDQKYEKELSNPHIVQKRYSP